MADGHEVNAPAANVHDDHGHDAPMQDDPDHHTHEHGGHAAQDDPEGHAPDAHGGHGPADDAWVLLPLAVGLAIGIVLVVIFGLASGAVPLT